MQRLVSLKLASDLTRKALSNSTAISLPHNRTFASHFTKRPQETHFFSHPWRSHSNALSPKLRGFASNPVLAKKLPGFSSNALLSNVARRGFAGFRGFQFSKRSFELDSSFRSSWRDRRSWLRGLTPDDVVLGLIVANVTVFLLWRVVDYRFMMKNFTISVENFKNGCLHTLITSAFSHMDTGHIIHNMIGLYFFGIHLGKVFGPEFLLKLYLAGGIAGSVFYLVHSAFLASSSKGQLWKDPLRTPALGASGAVNAIILLDIFLFPRSTLYFNFFIPVPAILLGIYLIGKDALGMIEGNTPGSAHLGGAAVAAIAWARLRRGRF